MKRVHIKTFGCQMNEYDSGDARLIGRLVDVNITQAMMNSYRGHLAVDLAET